MVPRVLGVVDHGVRRVGPHEVGARQMVAAHDVVPVAFVLDGAVAVLVVLGPVLGAELLEDVGRELAGERGAPHGVGRDLERHDRLQIAEGVLVPLVHGDLVAPLGQQVDHEGQQQLPGDLVPECPAQLRPAQVPLVHEFDQVRVGRTGRPPPAVVVDVHAESGLGPAEPPAAQIGDAARARGAAHRAGRLGQQAPGQQVRVVHQVVADQLAAAHPLHAGGEHEPGVLDGVGAENVDGAFHRVRLVLLGVERRVFLDGDPGDPSVVLVDLDLGGDRLRHDLDVALAERLGQRLSRVVFGLHGADRDAVGVALTALALFRLARAHRADRDEALAAVVRGVRHAITGLRKAAHPECVIVVRQVDAHAVHAPGDRPVEIGRRHAVHREHVSLRETHSQVRLVLDLGGHAQFGLGLPVVGLQVVIAERPVEALAVLGSQIEVLGKHAQRFSLPVHGGAAEDPGEGGVRAVLVLLHEVELVPGRVRTHRHGVGAPGHPGVRIERVRRLVVLDDRAVEP